ncbi:polyprenyl synthetase family protein [Candidatus Pelagibacter sp.]|nr:polyprenyl synthetase family protein [Candidatus Pelagibacter sp.]
MISNKYNLIILTYFFMGTVVQLRNQINNSYYQLKDSVDEKLVLVEEKIKSKLLSEVDLVQKMTEYHIDTGGKRLRALLTLGSAKLCGYTKGGRDINLAACVEMIHGATLMHDDVIDFGDIRRGKETLNSIWGNHSSVLIGDYLLSRCFEMMVEDGNIEVLKLLSSTSSKIAQGEVLQLQHKGEVDMLEETYLKIITAKTAELFSAATKVGAILSSKETKEKEALEFYGKNLGLTFQIADDTLDYNSDLKFFGKKIGKDFLEGKITLPVILLFQNVSSIEKDKLKNIFKQETRSNEDLNFTLELIKKYNIINECYKKAEHFINLASNSLTVFKDSEEKKILESLTSFSLQRTF